MVHMKSGMNIGVYILPRLILSNISSSEAAEAKKRKVGEYLYYYKDSESMSSYHSMKFNRFPIVLNCDNSVWKEGTIYLLVRAVGVIGVNMLTLHNLAYDLSAYRKFLYDEQLEVTYIPERKSMRPYYQYKYHLMSLCNDKKISFNTAKRRMSSVIGFYRWMKVAGLIDMTSSLWSEKDIYINVSDTFGLMKKIRIVKTDLSIKVKNQNSNNQLAIYDGGALKPLTKKEQKALIETLLENKNIEMRLIFMLALFTGARIQTILTLPCSVFLEELASGDKYKMISIGFGTGVDSKNNKRTVISVPGWLYLKVKTYVNSQRARKRSDKAKPASVSRLVFLTSQGSPYYMPNEERETFLDGYVTTYISNGQSVRQFLANKIIPIMRVKLKVDDFTFRFHDLRATFGLNISELQLLMVDKGMISLHQAREFVKTAMGHSNYRTTDGYLKYSREINTLTQYQDDYESYIKQLIGGLYE